MKASRALDISLPLFTNTTVWLSLKKKRIRKFGSNLCSRIVITLSIFLVLFTTNAFSQSQIEPLQIGEAVATRFSGTILDGAEVKIDPNGVVASILDIRNPGFAALGQHWKNEPQRAPITAGQVGQVFGIAIDNSSPPNIYLTSTAKFGLHLVQNDWMTGMWGEAGGPGTVYVLRADNNYNPEVLTEIFLGERRNSGAALGNIAFDPGSKQLFVSDMETGMIHRLDPETGEDRGHFDHGVIGRKFFFDAANEASASLEAIAFDPASAANFTGCDIAFSQAPDCWNMAESGRRVWGLGIYGDGQTPTRLFYSTWSIADEGVTNEIWSVALTAQGDFDTASVRRELELPSLNYLAAPMVSDIAFSADGEMLIAQNGYFRNLGLIEDNAFSEPDQAVNFSARKAEGGLWELTSIVDVGNLEIEADASGQFSDPTLRNAAGGVDFGFGYTDGRIDLSKIDGSIWMSGNNLCSPDGPCVGTTDEGDEDQVHGYQGSPREKETYDPASATPGDVLFRSFLVDADINDVADEDIADALSQRNDSSRIGDIEIYRTAGSAVQAPLTRPLPPASTTSRPAPRPLLPSSPSYQDDSVPEDEIIIVDDGPDTGPGNPPFTPPCHFRSTSNLGKHIRYRSVRGWQSCLERPGNIPETPPVNTWPCHYKSTSKMGIHHRLRSKRLSTLIRPTCYEPTLPTTPPTNTDQVKCHQTSTSRTGLHARVRSANGRPCVETNTSPCHITKTSESGSHRRIRSSKGYACREGGVFRPPAGERRCHFKATSKYGQHFRVRSRQGLPCPPFSSGGTPTQAPRLCHNGITSNQYAHTTARSNAGKRCKPLLVPIPPIPPQVQDPSVFQRPAPDARPTPGTRPTPEVRPTGPRPAPDARPTRPRPEPDARPTRPRPEPDARPQRPRPKPEARPQRPRPKPEARPQRPRPKPEARPQRPRPKPEARPQRPRPKPEARPQRPQPKPESRPQRPRPKPEARQGRKQEGRKQEGRNQQRLSNRPVQENQRGNGQERRLRRGDSQK